MVIDVATTGIFSTVAIFAMAIPVVISVRIRPGGAIDIAMLFTLAGGLVSATAAYFYAVTGVLFWSALNNAGYVLALGSLWCISAFLSEKRINPRWIVTGILSLAVLGAPFVDPGNNTTWRGGLLYLSVITVLSFASTFDLSTGQARELIQARASAWLFGAHGVFFAARLGVFIVCGPDDATLSGWLGPAVTSLFVVVLYIAGGNLLLSLRSNIILRDLARRLQLEPLANLLNADDFRARAKALLTELEPTQRRAVVVIIRVENFPELGIVYGRPAATAAAKHVVAVASEEFPVAALASRSSRDEFTWLMGDLTTDQVHNQCTEIGMRLRSSQIDGLPFLSGVSVSFGIADSQTISYDPRRLIAAARAALPPAHFVASVTHPDDE